MKQYCYPVSVVPGGGQEGTETPQRRLAVLPVSRVQPGLHHSNIDRFTVLHTRLYLYGGELPVQLGHSHHGPSGPLHRELGDEALLVQSAVTPD